MGDATQECRYYYTMCSLLDYVLTAVLDYATMSPWCGQFAAHIKFCNARLHVESAANIILANIMHIVTVILTIEQYIHVYLANIMHIVTVILTIENCQGRTIHVSC